MSYDLPQAPAAAQLPPGYELGPFLDAYGQAVLAWHTTRTAESEQALTESAHDLYAHAASQLRTRLGRMDQISRTLSAGTAQTALDAAHDDRDKAKRQAAALRAMFDDLLLWPALQERRIIAEQWTERGLMADLPGLAALVRGEFPPATREPAEADMPSSNKQDPAHEYAFTYDGDTMWLECGPCYERGDDEIVTSVEPGNTWDELTGEIATHEAAAAVTA
jgi:hypothetical protein